MKLKFKIQAIRLRKKGYSYSEILKKVPVAKSTLSLWLRSVDLSKKQKQRFTEKKRLGALKGAESRKNKISMFISKLQKEAQMEVNKISARELWLMGIMLYWAEGAKIKKNNISQGVIFSNSDPYMVRLFLIWLQDCLSISLDQILCEVYIHTSHNNKDTLKLIKHHWSTQTGFPVSKFDRIYFKQDKLGTKRKNIGSEYNGLLRIKIRKSTNLNRKIGVWVEAIYQQCRIV